MRKNKYLFLILFLSFLLMPMIAQAAGELVLPCYATGNCGICDAIKFATNLAGYIIYISGAAALFFFLYAGLVLIVSRGNASRIDKAQKIMIGTIVGLLLIYTAWVGVNFIIYSFADNKKQESVARIFNQPWQKFVCLKQETGAIVWQDVPANNNGTGVTLKDVTLPIDNACARDISTFKGDFNPFRGSVAQTGDISPELEKALTCMSQLLEAGVGGDVLKYNNVYITSISDSHGLVNCRDNYTRQCSSDADTDPNCCFHAKNSCHYGGGRYKNGSYAVDIRSKDLTADQNTLMRQLIEKVGGHYIDETNTSSPHHHMSVGSCGGG